MLRRVPTRARPLHLLVLVALAAALLPAGAASAQSSIDTVVDITFPVHDPQGLATYRDDYHDARGGGTRVHMATDIGGPSTDGLRIHAAVGGTITWITRLDGANVGTAGYALGVRGDDGHTYRYMHLGRDDWGPDQAYAPGMARGARVERGQFIGFLGSSGNASLDWPHLHFEICQAHDCTDRLNPFLSLRDAERRGDLPGDGVARTTGSGFVDVSSDHVHVDGIRFVDAAEITQGCRTGSFCPDQSVTRGQMATFLFKAFDLAPAGAHGFSDVPASHPHAEGIAAVAAAGISGGKGDGRFDPQAPVRRDQMATFLRNAMGLPGSDTTFPDVPAGSPHAEAIGAVADRRVALGQGDGTYRPMSPVSRAQMATFLMRAVAG